jgi:hypothetical protein
MAGRIPVLAFYRAREDSNCSFSIKDSFAMIDLAMDTTRAPMSVVVPSERDESVFAK